MEKLIQANLEDLAKCFGIEKDLFETFYKKEILENEILISIIEKRNGMGDWKKVTPLGGPGTVLNGVALYCLVRHYNMVNILETGVSGGFYTAFLLEGLRANSWEPSGLISIELSESPDVGNLLPESLRELDWWNLVTGKDSIKCLKESYREVKHSYLFCHDSLHTMSHMMQELMQFKRSEMSQFFVFIDDQNSDEFWRRCLQTGAFKKPGYEVTYVSGNECRVPGHLGGFIKFEKF